MDVEEARNWGIPNGLCAEKEDHSPHVIEIGSLAPFICTADQKTREPYRSEVERVAAGAVRMGGTVTRDDHGHVLHVDLIPQEG